MKRMWRKFLCVIGYCSDLEVICPRPEMTEIYGRRMNEVRCRHCGKVGLHQDDGKFMWL